MALEEYKRKRDFHRTPEPAGARPRAKKAGPAPLSFVIQKHAARRLHYDFRLELDGVLLSWAVPKGPSLDPGEKRLAVHVEDHPIEYGGFEGVIPKGQYGGGTVLLWDRGTWTPEGPHPAEAYRKGTLKFRLDGDKLHGKWALVRMGGRAAPRKPGDHENWLLIKERDDEAEPGSDAAIVEDKPLSVATGRSMEAIAAERDRVWDYDRGEIPGEPPTKAKAPTKKGPAALPKGARKRAMPDRFVAQLATLVEQPPDGDDWLHEIKFDGYRLLARIDRGKVRLLTRTGLDWTSKFPALAKALAELPAETAVVDGEVVAVAADGTTNFAMLQDRIANGDTGDLLFYAFDLLYRDGYDQTGATLEDRKAVLAELIARDSDGTVRFSDHQTGHGQEFFDRACGYELEGIMSKRRDRPYRPGRGTDWLKIKCGKRDEFIIVGFTDPAGQRHGFGALLLGYYSPQGELTYAGRVGTGFNGKRLTELRAGLDKLERKTPTVRLPKGVSKKGTHWVEPRLVAEIRYGNRTTDGILRHPSFQGLREDKPPEEIVYDPKTGLPPVPADAGAKPAKGRSSKPTLSRSRGKAVADEGEKASKPKSGGAPQVTAPARDGSITFEGVRLTHPDRVLYPEEGITKLAIAEYYAAVRDWVLPELADRPLSLVRCPEGYDKECFYQKHATSAVPGVVGRVEIPEGVGTGTGTYTYIKDLAGLVAMVQMGVLEIHPWGSTVKKLETPDRITFDFDPDVGLPWDRVTDAAIQLREALLGIGLESFPKTTGGKGLHVVVPIAPKLGWDEIKEFSKWVAERFTAAYPERFTTNMAKRARTGRIFIDYLRNGRGATAIGAYSARARAGAPVATPLSWQEVEKGVKPDRFTVQTVPDRLKRLKSDPWAEIGKLRQSISAKVRRAAGI
ncbi:MAG TPA: DNA ligase D [Stellaceae bacterium]|nr:DNA ligase D [Stellaceae bacterium]